MKKIMQTISIITLFVMMGCSTDNANNNANNNVNTTVTDIDGNVYPTVVIGTQTWTQTNLNVAHYRNGDVIPQVTDQTQWNNLTTGAWCYYNNDPANGDVYGKLYNWYAVLDSRGLAPVEYHIPSDTEWTTLTNYLGGYQYAGGKMKETGINHWTTPNTNATNSSLFTGLPGGIRNMSGYYEIGNDGNWLSSTIYQGNNGPTSVGRGLKYNYQSSWVSYLGEKAGFSIRCIKD